MITFETLCGNSNPQSTVGVKRIWPNQKTWNHQSPCPRYVFVQGQIVLGSFIVRGFDCHDLTRLQIFFTSDKSQAVDQFITIESNANVCRIHLDLEHSNQVVVVKKSGFDELVQLLLPDHPKLASLTKSLE